MQASEFEQKPPTTQQWLLKSLYYDLIMTKFTEMDVDKYIGGYYIGCSYYYVCFVCLSVLAECHTVTQPQAKRAWVIYEERW